MDYPQRNKYNKLKDLTEKRKKELKKKKKKPLKKKKVKKLYSD